jgi:hypothetical protein
MRCGFCNHEGGPHVESLARGGSTPRCRSCSACKAEACGRGLAGPTSKASGPGVTPAPAETCAGVTSTNNFRAGRAGAARTLPAARLVLDGPPIKSPSSDPNNVNVAIDATRLRTVVMPFAATQS